MEQGMAQGQPGRPPPGHARRAPRHQVLRDAPGFSHGEVSRCLRSRQSIWCSPQGWDTPGFSHGEEVTGETERDGKTNPVKIGVLMVWHKQDGNWKLLARQAVRLEEAPRTN
jgi:hypothetical protein